MVDRVLLPLFRGIAAVLLAVLLAVSVLLFGLDRYVFRDTVYQAIPQEKAFTEGMTAYVEDALQDECLFYDLPFDTIKQAVTEEWIADLSRQYTEAMYASLNSGDSVDVFVVDPAPYRTVLDAFFASLPKEEQPLDPNTAETLSKELAASTQHVLQGGVSDKLIQYGYRFVYGNATVQRVRSYRSWIWLLTAVLVVLCLLPFRSTWRRRLYATAGALFVGSALVFVPLQLLHWHNIPARWVLGDSPLKLYADGIWNGVIVGVTNTALWIGIVCAVLLLASIVLLVYPMKSKE